MNINNNETYKTQEEIGKMSYNEKFFPVCKCGKGREKPEPRWIPIAREGKKLFYVSAPFKGPKGEELCHKCAPCHKCGKDAGKAYENGFYRHEKTNDNPSGEWVLAYCSKECFAGTEKPNLPKNQFNLNQVTNCDHCGKLSEIKSGNASIGKVFCSDNCHNGFLSSLSPEDFRKIRRLCCVCSLQIFGQDDNFAKNLKDGKVYFSASNINTFYCSEKCFEKRGDKSDMNGSAWHDSHNPIQSDNSPKPNPPAEVRSNPSVNSVNQPQPNPGNSSEKPNPAKNDDEREEPKK